MRKNLGTTFGSPSLVAGKAIFGGPVYSLICAAVVLVLSFGFENQLIAQQFVKQNVQLPSTYNLGSSWADYDADGDMDLLAFVSTNGYNLEPRLYRNDQNNAFVRVSLPPATRTSSAYYGTSHFWADGNRDGRLDLLWTGTDEIGQPASRIFHGRSDGTFVDTHLYLEGEPMLWADLDNDGYLDLITVRHNPEWNSWIFWNQGGTNYQQSPLTSFVTLHNPHGGLSSVAAADCDQDGDLDLLVSAVYEDGVRLLRNDGNRKFVNTGIRFPMGNDLTSAWVDADGDGDLDFMLPRLDWDIHLPIALYRNDGNWHFTEMEPGLPAAVNIWRWADFDQDGDADVLVNSLPGPVIHIFLNNGAGQFTDSKWPLPALNASAAEVMDLDGDGDADFAISGTELNLAPSIWQILRNRVDTSGPSPQPPTQLVAEVIGNRAILHWTGIVSGNSFNLRVGTQPGFGDIICPLADSTGHRLISAMGNAQASSRWYLKGLAPGTYYWSVQAVSPSFQGSPFAAESSFVVPNQPDVIPRPTISEIPPQYTDEDTSALTVGFTIGPQSSLAHLSATAEGDDLELSPVRGLVITGEGTNRALTITLAPDQFGTSLITVWVTDAADQSASTTFLLTVDPVNDPPILDAIPNQVTYQNAAPLGVVFHAVDVDSSLAISAQSSNPDLMLPPAIEQHWAFPDRWTLQITPQPNRVGSAIITLIASDGQTETRTAFVVEVKPPAFVLTQDHLTDFGLGSVGWADLDKDGDLDLILTSIPSIQSSPPIRYYRNYGDGRLVDANLKVAGSGSGLRLISMVDYDSDGDIDLMLDGYAPILRNENGINFSVISNASTLNSILSYMGTGIWGDVDNDGDLDMLYTRSYPNELGVLKNNHGAFTLFNRLPQFPGYVALGDFDSDGQLDVAFSYAAYDRPVRTGIARGMSQALFPTNDIPLDQSSYGPVGWCDVNRDGLPDFWNLQFPNPDGRLLLYRNLGAGRYASPIIIPLNFYPQSNFYVFPEAASFRWADFDGDGYLDFIVDVVLAVPPASGRGSALAIYRNEGDFHFTPLGYPLLDVSPSYLSVGDVDNDGDVDLTATAWDNPESANSSSVRVLLNRMSQYNPAPGPPSGLYAKVTGNGVWLDWQPANDLNQPVGLSYNVRVGTRPGASDIVPAMSLASGFRQLVEFGNAGWRTNYFLTNLVGETFYWSVQAIDNCYIGGPFAPEQRFVISLPGNQSPTIGNIADQTMSEDSRIEVPFTVNDDRTPPDLLRLRAFASDPFLLPSSRLTFVGQGTNRSLFMQPATNQTGQARVTVEAIDAVGEIATRSFLIAITNVNDPPFIAAIPDQLYVYSVEPWSIGFTVGDPDTPADRLQLRAESSNPALVPSTNLVLDGMGSNRIVTILSNGPVEGDTTITLTVTDSDGVSVSTSFLLALHKQVFRLLPALFGGVRQGSMAWGDFDNDGDLDLALSGQGLNRTVIYRNEGNGQFVNANIDLPGVDGGGVEWGDIDNDGHLDLLIHGRNMGDGPWAIANLYRNLGGGKLELVNAGLSAAYGPAAFGDYDNDGRVDIVSAGQGINGNNRVVIYHNQGDGQFLVEPTPNQCVPGLNSFPALNHLWLDVDLDGNLDLIFLRYGYADQLGNILYLGDGHGGFRETPAPWNSLLLAWGDFDQDAQPDILESRGRGLDLRILRNLGKGIFAPWGMSLQNNFTPGSEDVGDFDNDGLLDVLSTGDDGNFNFSIRLFRGQANGDWIPVVTSWLDLKYATTSWADVDNDGDLDLLMNGQRDEPPLMGYSTLLYRNDQSVKNTPPTAPGGLRARFTTNAVSLTWQPAEDANQAGGLTYNVRIGTTPGGMDVLSPMSSPNGFRLVPKPGNAGWQTLKRMNGMRLGQTYYWSVQAVDNSYAGSPFSTEAVFTVGEPPAITILSNQSMEEDGVLMVPLHLSDPDGDSSAVSVAVSSSDLTLVDGDGLLVSGAGADRTLTIHPKPDKNGACIIAVEVVDAQGGSDTRSFGLTILPANDPPRVADQNILLPEDSVVVFSIAATDPDGDPLSYSILQYPHWGTLQGTGPQITYVPRTNFFGDDSCVYQVTDSHGASATGHVYYHVQAVPELAGTRIFVRFLSDRSPLVKLQCEPYQVFIIETSDDLRNWTHEGTYFSFDGIIEIVGRPAAPGRGRFYKAYGL